MGSFDGWSEGEHLSPEYTGSYTMFSTTLMLTPGRFLSVHLLRLLFLYLFYSTSLIYIYNIIQVRNQILGRRRMEVITRIPNCRGGVDGE